VDKPQRLALQTPRAECGEEGQMKLKQALVAVAAVVVLIEVSLLVSGRRLLIHERKVEPGEEHIVPDYGNIGEGAQASLACRYFTGRSTTIRVFWYAPNNMFGKDQCPFLLNDYPRSHARS
jgi:hypothetical protein